MIKYTVEVFFNTTDSVYLCDVLFISFAADIMKITRLFDEPIFNMNEIFKVEIKAQK